MYTQLSQEERYQIYAYSQADLTKAEISRKLNRSKSTIGRELKRNKGLRGYRPKQAGELCKQRHSSKDKAVKFTESVKTKSIELLKLKWSPEQIAGVLKKQNKPYVSPKTLYAFIHQDKSAGGETYTHLRQGMKKRRKVYGSKAHNKARIKDRVSIEQRPKLVDEKLRVGDWEGDTVVGKDHKGFIVTMVDRVSKLTVISKVADKTSATVTAALIQMMKPYAEKTYTITFDNGTEFSGHSEVAKALKADIFFAHPYASYERGLNENTNGLIRQWIPKKTDFRDWEDTVFKDIEEALNSRPRKTLNYATPKEIFTAA